jgi:hypothetical protein
VQGFPELSQAWDLFEFLSTIVWSLHSSMKYSIERRVNSNELMLKTTLGSFPPTVSKPSFKRISLTHKYLLQEPMLGLFQGM